MQFDWVEWCYYGVTLGEFNHTNIILAKMGKQQTSDNVFISWQFKDKLLMGKTGKYFPNCMRSLGKCQFFWCAICTLHKCFKFQLLGKGNKEQNDSPYPIHLPITRNYSQRQIIKILPQTSFMIYKWNC